MPFIYKIISLTKKIYVGSTTMETVEERWAAYKTLQCKNQTKLYNSLKKYGKENHIFELICECSLEEMFKLENYYGILYNVLDKDHGLNCRLPMKDENYSCMSDEMREKISNGKKNSSYIVSEETRQKQSASRIGDKNHNYGKPMPEEVRLKISKANSGKKRTKEICKAIGKSNEIPVIQYDLQGNFIREWESVKKAGIGLNIAKQNISVCCTNIRKTAGGFMWQHKHNDKFNLVLNIQ